MNKTALTPEDARKATRRLRRDRDARKRARHALRKTYGLEAQKEVSA